MRIGRTIIDTDSMTADELTVIINELRAIRKRRAQGEELLRHFTEVIEEAKANGFTFIDKDFGNVLESKDFTLLDERGACP